MSRTSKASKAGEDTATRITLLPVYAQCKKTSNCAPDLVCEHSTHQCKKQVLAACGKREECAYNQYCDHGQCKKGPEVICRKGRWECKEGFFCFSASGKVPRCTLLPEPNEKEEKGKRLTRRQSNKRMEGF